MCFCDFLSINYISAPYSPISVSKLKSQMAEQVQNLPVADAFLFSDQAKLSHLDWWQWWMYFDYSDTQVDANVVWDEFEIMRAVGSWSIGPEERWVLTHLGMETNGFLPGKHENISSKPPLRENIRFQFAF